MNTHPGIFEAIANRLFASWKTTALAVILCIVIAYLGITGKVEWDKLQGYVSTAVLFLFFKDGKVIQKEQDAAVEEALEDPNRARAKMLKKR
jgi:hypothetical protein